MMSPEGSFFGWGGALACSRQVFDHCEGRESWKGSLSDDYSLSATVRAHGYKIRFVPRALSLSHGSCSLPQLLRWSTRQMAITRVYHPNLWRVTLLSQLLYVVFAFFIHGNVKIPLGLDRVLRWVIVTPDVHRVHHSTVAAENNANFAGFVTWWDRLFGTYRDQPEHGHEGMVIGLEEFRNPKHLKLHWILANPFLSAGAEAARASDRLAPSVRPAAAAAASSK